MNKLEEFIKYLKGQVSNHSIYVWGAQGAKGRQYNGGMDQKKRNLYYQCKQSN